MKNEFKMTFFKERKSMLLRDASISVLTYFPVSNTTAGWINLLLLSSSGPIKFPVGAW